MQCLQLLICVNSPANSPQPFQAHIRKEKTELQCDLAVSNTMLYNHSAKQVHAFIVQLEVKKYCERL